MNKPEFPVSVLNGMKAYSLTSIMTYASKHGAFNMLIPLLDYVEGGYCKHDEEYRECYRETFNDIRRKHCEDNHSLTRDEKWVKEGHNIVGTDYECLPKIDWSQDE